jgi:signal transduction histidine kinase
MSSALEIGGSGADAELRGWLTSDFLEEARATAESFGFSATVETQAGANGRIIARWAEFPDHVLRASPVPDDTSLVVVYTAVRRDERQHLYGFVLDLPAYGRALIEDAIAGPPLLPPSLAGPSRDDQVLSLAAWTLAGDTIFRTSGATTAGTEVVDTLRLDAGPLVAGLALHTGMASRLVIGGLPASRFPLLLGTFGLTLILIGIAALQFRRQQELFRLRADFVSGVSHELRTPLAQIRLFADLLASGRLDHSHRERSLRILTEESQRLTYLVENVLRFSRSERLTERISPVSTPIAPMLREIVDDFRPLARSREVEIDLAVQADVQATLDADAIRQVLLNLLDNAVKYGPRGQRVEVRAGLEGESLRIEVDDRGPGIPGSERRRIWEPYRRLDREVEAATGGSGIGLAVVRELVSLHGGSAEVLDRPGGGSRFVIVLPGAAISSSTDAALAGENRSRAEA